MSQVEPLILPVDTRQVKDGEKALDGLTAAGGRAQRATDLMRQSAVAFGAAAGTAATTIAVMTKQSIDAADAMNDMHLRTGIAFKSLAAYDQLARQSGTSINGMAQGFKFLSRYMVEHGDKLRAIGVTSKDTNVAMAQFADIIQRIEDPALRTALAMEVLGRSGDELIPALVGGGDALREAESATVAYGDALRRAAPLADEFNDLLEVGQTHIKTFGLSLAGDLLPPLIESARYFLEAGDEIDGFNVAGEAGKIVVQTLAVLLANLSFVAQGVGREIGGIAAQLTALATGNLAGFTAIGQALKEDGEKARAALDEFEKRVMATGAAAGSAAPEVEKLSDAERERIESLLRGKTAQDDAIKKAQEWIVAIKRETAEIGLDAEQKRMMEAATVALTVKSAELRAEIMAAAGAWNAKVTALAAAAEATKRLREQEDNYADNLNRYEEGQMDAALALENKIREINFETRALTVNEAQLREMIVLRELEKSGLDKTTDAYAEYRKRLEEALAANDVAKEQQKATDSLVDMWRQVEDVAHDTFVSIFDSGKSAFDRLRDTLKNGLYSLLYQMTIKPLVIQIAGSLSGGNVASQAFGGGGGGGFGNLLNAGSSLLNIGSGAGAVAGSVAASNLIGAAGGDALGSMIALNSANWGVGAAGVAGGGALGAIGAALPWIGGALAIGSLLGMFGNEPAPPEMGLKGYRRGTNAGFDAAIAEGRPNYVESEFGILRAAAQHVGDDPAGYAAQLAEKYLKPVAALDDTLASFLDRSQISKVQEALDNWKPGEMETSGGFKGQLADRLATINEQIGGFVNEIFSTFDAKLEEGYALTVALLRAQGRDTYELLARDLAGAADATAGSVAALLGDLLSVNDIFNALDLTLYDVDASGAKAASSLVEVFDGLENLAAATTQYYNLFYSEEEKLANAMSSLSDTFAAMNLVMPGSKEGFRAMVEAAQAAGVAGQEIFADLLAIAPTVASVFDAAQGRIDEARDAVKKAQDDLARAYEAEARAKESLISTLGKYIDNIRSFRDSLMLGGLSPLSPSGAGQFAASQFRALSGRIGAGDTSALDSLPSAAGAFLTQQMAGASSRTEYARAVAEVMATLDAGEKLAGDQIDVADASLQELKAINENTLTVAQATMALAAAQGVLANVTANAAIQNAQATAALQAQIEAEAARRAEEAAATATSAAIASARATVDAIKGVSAKDMTKISDAAATAIAAASGASDTTLKGGTRQQYASAIQSAIGADVSALGKADLKQIAQSIGLKGFANGGTFMGMATTGERGQEIIYSAAPVRVLSNQQSKAAVIEGGDVTRMLAAINASIITMQKDARKTADLLQRVTRDGESLVTTPA